MIKLILELFQALWPFLKESWFQGEAFTVWVKRNKLSVLWLFIMFVMVIAVITLVSELRDYHKAYSAQTAQLNVAQKKVEELNKKYVLLKDIHQEYLILDGQNKELQTKYDDISNWVRMCGLEKTTYEGMSCPASKTVIRQSPARVTKPPVSRYTVPRKPSPQVPRESLRDKIKRVFGNN